MFEQSSASVSNIFKSGYFYEKLSLDLLKTFDIVADKIEMLQVVTCIDLS